MLNGRAGIHVRAAARANGAGHGLGHRPETGAARLPRGRNAKLVFVLPSGTNSFVGMLDQQVHALAPWLAELRATAVVQRVDVFNTFSPVVLARHLSGLQGRCDAVIAMAPDHPQVRAAVDDLVAAGIVVVTLVSDVTGSRRSHFVGIDNVAAGRTAGTLLGRFVKPPPKGEARIGVVLGSRSLHDHAERLFGFEQVLAADYPHLRVLPPLEAQDLSARAGPLTARLLRDEPKLAGIYSIGAGNRGILAALSTSGRARQVVWVCHELTAHARRALVDGVAHAVINQDAGHEVRSACRLALAQLSGKRVLPEQERIRIDIFVKENLP
jgi:LacI family transcriptional regulator